MGYSLYIELIDDDLGRRRDYKRWVINVRMSLFSIKTHTNLINRLHV